MYAHNADRVTAHRKAVILDGLLNACVENLQRQGMTRVFLDGVTGEPSDLLNLGSSFTDP